MNDINIKIDLNNEQEKSIKDTIVVTNEILKTDSCYFKVNMHFDNIILLKNLGYRFVDIALLLRMSESSLRKFFNQIMQVNTTK